MSSWGICQWNSPMYIPLMDVTECYPSYIGSKAKKKKHNCRVSFFYCMLLHGIAQFHTKDKRKPRLIPWSEVKMALRWPLLKNGGLWLHFQYMQEAFNGRVNSLTCRVWTLYMFILVNLTFHTLTCKQRITVLHTNFDYLVYSYFQLCCSIKWRWMSLISPKIYILG